MKSVWRELAEDAASITLIGCLVLFALFAGAALVAEACR